MQSSCNLVQVEGTYFRPENGIRLGAAAECNDTTPVWSSTAPSSAGFATTVYNRTGAQVFFVGMRERTHGQELPKLRTCQIYVHVMME